jgi:hypothetical protein
MLPSCPTVRKMSLFREQTHQKMWCWAFFVIASFCRPGFLLAEVEGLRGWNGRAMPIEFDQGLSIQNSKANWA